MSDKVILVTRGDYSDYHICAAFRDMKLAEAYANHLGGDVEEIEILDDIEPLLREGLFVFYISINREGNIPAEPWELSVKEYDPKTVYPNYTFYPDFKLPERRSMGATILAKDKTHAIKIAGEMRAQILAADEWGINPVE